MNDDPQSNMPAARAFSSTRRALSCSRQPTTTLGLMMTTRATRRMQDREDEADVILRRSYANSHQQQRAIVDDDNKVATTEWRKILCLINADDCVRDPKSCGKKKCAWMTMGKDMPEDAPWADFLRDPLERLLSVFLNKCIDPRKRRTEGHCEPNVIFNARSDLKDEKGKNYPSLMEHLEGEDKQLLFAAYLGVLPLQAIACDLRRNIHRCAFVGNMGEDFMFDIERMANQFGGTLPELLNASFGYMEYVQSRKRNMGKDNSRHSTHALGKVKQFYTAQTVRRGLELMSIDYVRLGLKVPEWARQMLRDDASRAFVA
ncbi:hypothetical protein ACHAXA_001862 [Cyclostephanos tholiformis]|uniref:Uncharacterized protein n=1 Tax=Cyclostephanos tholiformis TaxID=382380 RepID=A0ABD3RGV0_9STRA